MGPKQWQRMEACGEPAIVELRNAWVSYRQNLCDRCEICAIILGSVPSVQCRFVTEEDKPRIGTTRVTHIAYSPTVLQHPATR